MPYLLNRAAVQITPTKKCMEWIRKVDDEGKMQPSDREIKEATTIYLVDEIATGTREEHIFVMEKYFLEIAIQEFAAWWTDDNDWPVIRNLKEFEAYFKWKLIEMVMDTTEQPLKVEEV